MAVLNSVERLMSRLRLRVEYIIIVAELHNEMLSAEPIISPNPAPPWLPLKPLTAPQHCFHFCSQKQQKQEKQGDDHSWACYLKKRRNKELGKKTKKTKKKLFVYLRQSAMFWGWSYLSAADHTHFKSSLEYFMYGFICTTCTLTLGLSIFAQWKWKTATWRNTSWALPYQNGCLLLTAMLQSLTWRIIKERS